MLSVLFNRTYRTLFVAQAFADRVPRRTLLVTLNLIRAGVASALLVRQDLGLCDEALALTLAAFGAGSMVRATATPMPSMICIHTGQRTERLCAVFR
ncbi:hypothetical protein [Pelagibius sp.]|uniref:hypothetical protein n=1 Tax=Pelagibius sp. TaxID=1931238 RepID=UPI003BB1969B